MLVLSRRVGQRIRIAEDIEVVVTAIQGERIKIGIEAPKSVRVVRGELLEIPPTNEADGDPIQPAEREATGSIINWH